LALPVSARTRVVFHKDGCTDTAPLRTDFTQSSSLGAGTLAFGNQSRWGDMYTKFGARLAHLVCARAQLRMNLARGLPLYMAAKALQIVQILEGIMQTRLQASFFL